MLAALGWVTSVAAQDASRASTPLPTPTNAPATPPGATRPASGAQDTPKFLSYVRAKTGGAKVRNIYDAQGVVIGELPAAAVLTVHGERAGWLDVEAAGGFSVWVYGEFVIPTSQPGVLQINASDVRMRPLPSSGPESLPLRQLLGNGQRVRLIGRKDLSKPLAQDWVNVWSPAGTRGWVAASETEPLPASVDGAALWAAAVTEARDAVAPIAADDKARATEASQTDAVLRGDSKEVSDALRTAEAAMTDARALTQAGGVADYAAVRQSYAAVLALRPTDSTKQLVEDRMAICTAYMDGQELGAELESQLASIDATLKRRQEEMAKAASRRPLDGRYDERGWVEQVEVLGEERPVYVLRWRGDNVAEVVCTSGRFDLADYLDAEIGVKGRELRGPIFGPTAALTRARAIDVTRIEVVSARPAAK